jgi:hypothetical protein
MKHRIYVPEMNKVVYCEEDMGEVEGFLWCGQVPDTYESEDCFDGIQALEKARDDHEMQLKRIKFQLARYAKQ